MRLHLVTADATKIVADLQLVKHFDGLFGGAEKALDKATNGSLQSTLAEMESNRFLNSRIVGLSRNKVIGSKNLLVLNLGDINHFTLGDLAGAVTHATKMALEHGFKTIATPVIGISDDVGLPIERAYRTVLSALLSTLVSSEKQGNSLSNITDLTIFDFSLEKVDFFCKVTEIILTELGVNFKRLTNMEFDVQVENTAKTDVLTYVPSIVNKSKNTDELERPEVIKVLFLAANPRDTQPLRLDEEIREIDTAFRQAEYRNRFDIRQHWAVRIMDLQSHLLRHQPNILHFSGHGNTASSILLEDINGNCQAVPTRALGRLFAVLKDNIRCVVLNACYSEDQAIAIAEHIDCVIGMTSAVSDKAAINFATAFYHALGYGRDVKTAFDLGCIQIDMENLGEEDTPRLIANRLDPKDIKFIKNA
jgi:hypothetical protein